MASLHLRPDQATEPQAASQRARIRLLAPRRKRAARDPALAFYGIPKSQIVHGWPSTAPSHDAACNYIINSGGLAAAWRFYIERLTAPGRWFLIATAAFFISGVNSLELQAYGPLLYSAALWLLAFALSPLMRPRASMQVRHAGRVCAGETLPVDVAVQADARNAERPLRLLAHRLPATIDAVPREGVTLAALQPDFSWNARLGLRCHRRGVYRLKGWRVETSFPFGLINASRHFGGAESLIVYPRFTPLQRLEIPTGRRNHPGGVALASEVGDSFEYLGNREFRQGDNVRDIDWRATARLERPIVREYREEYFLRVAVVLDTHVPPAAGEAGRDAFEAAVSLCAAVSDYMARQEYLVDILAAGPDLYHLTAGRALAYLDQILDILACVEANMHEPFTVLEPEIAENLDKINTVICVFLDWNDSRRDFVQRLLERGSGVKVTVVRDGPCSIDPATEAHRWGGVTMLTSTQIAAGVHTLY